MEKLDEKTIDLLIDELRDATKENLAASRAEKEVKIRKEKAHKRLLLAREALRGIDIYE